MKCTRAIFLTFLVAVANAATSKVNPLGKVMELLDELAAKVTKDGEAEAKAYKEYFEYCDDAVTEKGFEIKTASSTKEKLEADIGKEAAIAAAAAPRIEELAASIAEDEAELKSAAALREKEAADFSAAEAELLDVIDTLTRALSIVEREMAKNPAALTQIDTSSFNSLVRSLSTVVDAASFPSADKKRLLAFVQAQQSAEEDDGDLGAPAATVYKTHSTGVADVLEDL